MKDVWKAFHGIQALRAVSFECQKGEIHALLGANGAGKSTLMNILVGAVKADRGEIWINDQLEHFTNPKDAIEKGIAIIRQEIDLIPWMTAADNIFLGREPLTERGLIDQKKLVGASTEVLSLLGVSINPTELVVNLSVAQQQLVMIAKALSLQAEIIIMDEPSTSLAERELERLFEIARNLCEQGKTIVYISHRLDEVFEICNRATVLRDGEYEGTVQVDQVSSGELIRMMVGKEQQRIQRITRLGNQEEAIFEARGLTTEKVITDINLNLHAGEVLGITGLMGAGKTTVARTLFGVDPFDSGKILMKGKELIIKSPQDAIGAGIILVPEDRRVQGLFMQMPITKNIGITHLDRTSKHGFVSNRDEQLVARQAVEEFDIKTTSIDKLVSYLSGGNQQKVVLAKWLSRKPKVIILDEPTRGIDVGAKVEIYNLINRLADEGAGIILASSELPELLLLCDTILVLYEGRVMGTLSHAEATQERILTLASGMSVGAL
jgi:ABC-type sugar transport system ATPase subunit